jgi:hypothetical protein
MQASFAEVKGEIDMKFKIFTTATLFGLLLVPLAHAQVTGPIQGNIPFQFQVGETVLPAGEYVVSRNGPAGQLFLAIRGLDQKTGAILFMAPPQLTGSAQDTKLVFHRYGSTYFLRQVWQGFGQSGNELSLSKTERVIARQMAALATPHKVELASVSFHPPVK